MTKAVRIAALAAAGSLIATGLVIAQQLDVDLHDIDDKGVGPKIGRATITEEKGVGGDKAGLTITVKAAKIPVGQHGFHVHEKGNCGPAMKDGRQAAGEAAGPHYDPDGAKSHQGPAKAGHKGDLPVLEATGNGVDQTVKAPRLKLADVQGKALIIHKAGDTYADEPKDGGGAERIACGVVPGQKQAKAR